eukprot:TRINITY_DN6577_c0_g3_i1.p1 TRINITY_DN6577_c0_g3~~TRINITY_DN6577_c0_g3_i1.p1  ORF type:complete len:118 (-),score=33.94 TRINITY_DN6577_c0_g3_i1:361-714(-)
MWGALGSKTLRVSVRSPVYRQLQPYKINGKHQQTWFSTSLNQNLQNQQAQTPTQPTQEQPNQQSEDKSFQEQLNEKLKDVNTEEELHVTVTEIRKQQIQATQQQTPLASRYVQVTRR